MYHPPYHGKSSLDGHFRKTKDKIDDHPILKWPKDVNGIRCELENALSGTPSTTTLFLPYPHRTSRVREALVIRNVTLVKSIKLIKDSDHEWRVIQDGLEVPLNRKPLGEPSDEKATPPKENAHEDDDTIRRAAMCRLITQQKVYLEDRGAITGCAPGPLIGRARNAL